MQSRLTAHDYHRISNRYPSSPSYEEFVEMFTEFAFHEIHAQKDRLRNNFNWDYIMPRIARTSVKEHCRRAGIRPPQDYPKIVIRKLASLYDHHDINSDSLMAASA